MVYKIVIGLLFVINIYAQTDLQDIKTYKADFKQTVINESNKELKYEGTLFIDSVGKVLWQYKTPIIKNVYLLKNSVIIDEPELEQAIYTKLENGIDFINLLKKAQKIDNNHFRAKVKDIDYDISLKNGKIDLVTYKDQLGNSVIIKLNNSEKNIPLENEIFTFLPPEYYDIIKQ